MVIISLKVRQAASWLPPHGGKIFSFELGRPAAVILDDALVFSDDRRRRPIFDILNMAVQNVQVIKLIWPVWGRPPCFTLNTRI